MSQFDKDRVEIFLGAVRKYMQVRGPMSQKDLAELTDTGVSTMSRFLNQQTKELNENLIANITAKLSIPLHEIIDFVEESYTDQFIRLVKFYKGEDKPTVEISSVIDDKNCIIKIIDNGVGIKPGKLEDVFEIFKKIDARFKGIGAGLSVTRKILERYDGDISVKSTLGEGTEVTITLPLEIVEK